MTMADDLGERTEEATPRRRTEAREEGRVAKSQDLGGAMMLLLITLGLAAVAMQMIGQGKALLGQALGGETTGHEINSAQAWSMFAYLGIGAVRLAAPILLIAVAAAFLSQTLQIGWVFAPQAAAPSLRKLHPLNGFKRIFGLAGVVKSGLDVVKVILVLAVAVPTIMQHGREIVLLPYLTTMQSLQVVGGMLFVLAIRTIAVLLVLGLIDFMYQRWRYSADLKMTKQQVKDEMKQSEGDPDVKRRRLRMQQQIALQRISTAVPKADVVVTNPEHISIAIQYDQATMRAPKVVAKGADFLAMRIRQIALQHGIPIVERRPLARSLYKDVAVNQEIPPAYYKAVAEILAYVFRLSAMTR